MEINVSVSCVFKVQNDGTSNHLKFKSLESADDFSIHGFYKEYYEYTYYTSLLHPDECLQQSL